MKKLLCLSLMLLCFSSFMGFARGNNEKADTSLGTAYQLSKAGNSYEAPMATKASKEWTIGIVLPHLANPHFIGQAYGYTDEAKKLGVKVIIYEAGGYRNLENQLSQVEDLISMPVDALILVAVNSEGSIPMVNKANASGIPVINCNVMTSNENVVTRIRSDDSVIGELQAKYMVDKLNGKGNVLMIAGAAGTSWAEGRAKGFKDHIEKNAPGIKILDVRYIDNNEPSKGLAEMEDLLQTYNDVQGVMTGSAVFGIGVAQAIAAAGKSNDIIMTSVDIFADSLNAIKEGRIDAIVCQDTVAIGRWGVKAAVNVLEGKADQLYKNTWTPVHLITTDNADTFNFVGVAEAPIGWKLK